MFSRSKKKKVYVIDIFGVIEAASSSISLSKKNTDMQKVIKTLHKIAGKDREDALKCAMMARTTLCNQIKARRETEGWSVVCEIPME